MAEQVSEREALFAHIRARWPRMSHQDAEDGAQEALSRALLKDGALRDRALIDQAKLELGKIAADARWQKKRMPRSSIDAADRADALKAQPKARRRVGPRRPKGLLPCLRSGGFQLVEVGSGTTHTDEQRLGAFLLRKLILEGIEANDPMPAHVGQRALRLFRELFGHGPLDSWANTLMNQLAAAKLAAIAPREQARTPDTTSEQTALTFVEKQDPSKTERRVALRTELVSRRGPLSIISCHGDLGDGQGERLLTTMTVLPGSWGIEYPSCDRERAQLVLALTVRALAHLPVACPIPDYALDVDLIVWLEMRMGFQGGGGPHSLTEQKLLHLLLHPDELANAIEDHGKRMARRAQGKAARQLLEATRSLATRVRARAQATASI